MDGPEYTGSQVRVYLRAICGRLSWLRVVSFVLFTSRVLFSELSVGFHVQWHRDWTRDWNIEGIKHTYHGLRDK